MVSVSLACDSERKRRSANYPPSLWEEHWMALANSDDSINKENQLTPEDQEQHEELKEQVRKMLVIVENDGGKSNGWRLKKLELIDAIQRLGVAYHFETEIKEILLSLDPSSMLMEQERDDLLDDLNEVALRFRLLRQLGRHASCDVFNKFKDEEGNFKESLASDVQGLLSFYEAANYMVHNEDVLEEAMEFTTSKLVPLLPNLDNFWAARVKQALELPVQKTINRMGARQYMRLYELDRSHDEILLNFAKLDFNIVQRQHLEELKVVAKWWKRLDHPNKFPFTRDRIVELFCWIVEVYFEPKYSSARVFLTKIIKLISIMDDIYDTYGFLDELILFTDVIERWDINALNQLPPYMADYYRELLNVYSEIEESLAKSGNTNQVDYGISAMKDIARAYFQDAKWIHSNGVPYYEEYMKAAIVTSTHPVLAINSLVCMGKLVTEADLQWISKMPLILSASSVICRLLDDMVDFEWKKERGEVASAVACYMKQYGTSIEETFVELRKLLTNAWKDTYQEWLNPTSGVPKFILEIILNFSRMMHVLYQGGNDGYTNPDAMVKDWIASVLFDPVTI